MLKRFAVIGMLFMLLFFVVGCQALNMNSLQNKMSKAEQEIMDQGAFTISTSIDIESDILSYSDNEKYQIGLDPYYIYTYDGRKSTIVFRNDTGDYYNCELNDYYDQDDVYLSEKIDATTLEELAIPTLAELTQTTSLELSNVKKTNGQYIATMTFEELIATEAFAAYGNIFGDLNTETEANLMASIIEMTFSFENGISMTISFNYDVYVSEDNQVNISTEITSEMIGISDPIDVYNRDQFVILDNLEIENAEEITIDQLIDLPRALSKEPYNYRRDYLYYQIYLEEGHYKFDTDAEYYTKISFYSDADLETKIDLYETPKQFDLLHALNVKKADTYYFRVSLETFINHEFTIKQLDYDDYGSENVVDLIENDTYTYTLEGEYDTVIFDYQLNYPLSVVISGLSNDVLLYVANSDEWEDYDTSFSRLFFDDTEYYYMILDDNSYYLFLLELEDTEKTGFLNIYTTRLYPNYYHDAMLEITDTYSQPIVVNQDGGYFAINIDEAGMYTIDCDLLTTYYAYINSTIYNMNGKAIVDEFVYSNTNDQNTIYLEAGYYCLHLSAGVSELIIRLKLAPE